MKNPKENDGLQELSQASGKANRRRNLILTFAVAMAIVVLFSSFSVAKGKIVIDSVKKLRENGSAASAYLENGKAKQYKKLKNLKYIEDVGLEHEVGAWHQKGALLAACKVVDKTGYENIIKPAYDGIAGHYPTNQNEIMLSKRLLKKLGIQKPELGMKISVPIQFDSWSVNGGNELTQEFVLSGYYTDYTKEEQYITTAYLSEKYLKTKQIPAYPAKLLVLCKTNLLSRTQMENQLYKDVPLTAENQQFMGIEPVNTEAVNEFIGGYEIAVLCTILILLSAYLLIYNVLSISLSKDIQYYGLLFTIGLTQKQVKKIMFRQNKSILIKGAGAGIVISLLVSCIGFPILFRGLFLQQMGKISIKTILYPEILAGAVFIVSILMLLANEHCISKLKKLSPIEAYRHKAVTTSRQRLMKSQKGASLGRMARYNLFRSKRKFFMTLITLFLGCEMALLTVFISNGADTMNQLRQKPDFKIGTSKEAVDAYLWPYRNEEQLPADRTKSLFDETFMETLTSADELDKSSLNEIWGCYASYVFSDEFVQPLEDATYGTGESNTAMTIQVVNDAYIQKLEGYVKENHLDIDTDSLSNGNGILVLHNHELSEMSAENAREMTGRPAQVYSLDGDYDPEDQGVEFVCSGYLDTTLKGFPQLEMSWNGEGIHYFLVSEKGYERLNYPKQVFGFTINAKNGLEASAKAQLTELIRKKNSEQEVVNIYYLASTSDEIAQSENYINNSRIVMFALCLSLFLLGITNYLNALITNMVARKKEFAIMESVGMTRKQLIKMLTIEGLYYWGLLLITIMSVGTLMIWGVGVTIKRNLSYFTFIYPLKELVIVAVILLFFCVVLPQVVYRKTSGGSPIEQLKDN